MNSLGIQLRIGDLLFAVQKRWKLIISLTFLGLVFGLLLSAMSYVQSTSDSYQVSGSFIISAVSNSGTYSSNTTTPNRNDMTLASEMYDSVYYLLRSDRLLYEVINGEQLIGVSVSDIRNGMSISRYNETTIITFKLTWDNMEEAERLWMDILNTANRLLSEIVQVGQLRIVNEPQLKTVSAKNDGLKTWMILPIFGGAAGVGFSIVEVLMRPTLINVKDVETVFELETIGIIPYDSRAFLQKQSLLVEDETASSEVRQNYSAAAYILRNRLGSKEKCQCFYITSTTGQEGRTTAAANLAVQLSDMEKRTLMIDFDYKNPMLGSLFLSNLDYNRSLNALYRGEIGLSDAITTLTGHLDLLPMVMEHNLINMDSTIIDMISQLREQYDYIVIDAPPVGKESETLSLNQVANTVLFVVRYDTASIPEIQAALQKLDKSGIRILGCIVNGVQTTRTMMLGDKNKEAASKNSKAKTKKTKAKGKKTTKFGALADKKENDETLRQLTSQEKPRKTQLKGKGKGKGTPKAASPTAVPAEPVPPTPGPEEIIPPTPAPAEIISQLEAIPIEPSIPEPQEQKEEKKRFGLFGRRPPKEPKPKAEKSGVSAKEKKPRKERPAKATLVEKKTKNKNAKEDPFDKAVREAAVISSSHRNVFEDLMGDEYSAPQERTDAEMTEALLKMGLDGSWSDSGSDSVSQEKKPRSGRRNIFDDL